MSHKFPQQNKAVSHAFSSVGAGSKTVYIGGFYFFGSSANDFNPSINFGTANSAYAAHVGFVCDVTPGADTSITVTGTSITDAGVRTGSDTEVVTFLNGDAQGTYRETAKKFIGQVTIEKTSGSDRLCNYLFAKYWDDNNQDFVLVGFECVWFGGGTDGSADLLIYHHKATGWTYNVGSEPTPPTPLYRMQTIYGAEHSVVNNEPGAFKRSDVSDNIMGNDGEGLIGAAVQTTGQPFEAGTMKWTIVTDN